MDLFHLAARLTLDTDGYERSIDSAKAKGQQLAGAIKSMLGKLAIGAGITQLTRLGVTYNNQIESYTTNFKVMLGSVEDAVAKVEELKTMAAKTPFGLSDLANATQTLLSFQVDANKTTDVLSMLGDVALGDAQKLSGLALVFGQVASAGKLSGQDLLQFINAGFNPLNYIAERTGETMEKLRERMSKGLITVKEVEQALKDATSQGGQFYRGMDEASKTTSGIWSTLQDDWTAFVGNLMQPINVMLRDKTTPAALRALERLSTALFDTEAASEAVKASLFTDENGEVVDPSATMKTWYDNLLAVWADGKTEDDVIVNEFVTAFGQNTSTLKSALIARVENLTGVMTPEEQAEAEAQLKKLSEMQSEIEGILNARQGGYLTDEDKSRLESMLATITQMQAALEASASAETVMSSWERFISVVGDASVIGIEKITDFLVWITQNYELVKEVLKGAAAGFTGIKVALALVGVFSGPVTAVLSAVSAAAVWVITHWETLKQTALDVWAAITEAWGSFLEWWNTYIVTPIQNAIDKIREFLGLKQEAGEETTPPKKTNYYGSAYSAGMGAPESLAQTFHDPLDVKGFATGLDYVPYDDFPAYLHRGEAVLTSMEAQEWRGGGQSITKEELTVALTDAMKPMIAAIKSMKTVLTIDKKVLAEASASENRSAISGYDRRVALGVGK